MAEKKSTNARNPLVGTPVIDTISKCRCAIDWIANVKDDETAGNTDREFGRFLIMQTVVAALQNAEQQLETAPRLEVVNG